MGRGRTCTQVMGRGVLHLQLSTITAKLCQFSSHQTPQQRVHTHNSVWGNSIHVTVGGVGELGTPKGLNPGQQAFLRRESLCGACKCGAPEGSVAEALAVVLRRNGTSLGGWN